MGLLQSGITLADPGGLQFHPADDTLDASLAPSVMVVFASRHNPGRPGPSLLPLSCALKYRRKTKVPCDILLVHPNCNDWFASGLRAFGHSAPDQAAAELNALLAPYGYSQTLFMGNSMGGYAALAYGALCSADRVLAFAPQTRFDAAFHRRIGETRAFEDFETLRALHDVASLRLRRIWLSAPSLPSAAVHVGDQIPQDLAFVDDIIDLPQNQAQIHPGSAHEVLKDLHAGNALPEILARFVQNPSSPC